MEDLKTIKELIKSEIAKTKDELLRSNDKRAIRFFLNSITDDILEMIKEGFNYKEQLTIINKSSHKRIGYNTYIRYVKECVLKNGQNNLGSHAVHNQNSGFGKKERKIREDREPERDFGFTHEAVPDMEELY